MRSCLAAALFLFVFSQQIAYALQNDSEPPAAPSGEGLLFARALYSNGSAAANVPIVLLARSSSAETIYRLFTDSAGGLVLSLSNGSYWLDAVLDRHETSGMDFASTASLEIRGGGNATLIFYPAGSLAGTVAKGGSPLPGARVHVSCPSSGFDYGRINGGEQAQAGEAGDFLFRALPVGTCIVSASTDSYAGSEEVQISHGQTSSVSVDMENKASDNFTIYGIAIAALVLLLAIAALYFAKSNSQKSGKPQKAEPLPATSRQSSLLTAKEKPAVQEERQSQYDSPKAKAVLATLSEREREIVRFLFKCNGRAKRSQMQHKLLIPKTSLLRNLRSLERKNIIQLTPFGRNLLAELQESLFK